MSDFRITRLMTLFEQALEVPRDQRATFVQEVSGGDDALSVELTTLLEAHESSTGYFDQLADAIVAPAYDAIVSGDGIAASPTLRQRLQAALQNSYEIIDDLGGTMSRVFLARETKLGRKVVIKVLPPEMAAGASADRFRREIQLAAHLQHAHIVPLLTSDVADSLLYYTMPFVAGESLRARLSREGRLPVDGAQRIWRDMLEALAHAHASGVVHRDIKPANVLLSGKSALVSDFGIARAIEAAGGDASQTASGLSIGTPAYMAPEQVTGDKDADHRVDIYAAALVMYEMLEGRLPFSGDSIRALVLARLTRDPSSITRIDCPRPVASLVMRCLAKDPAARPQSVEAMLAELEAPPVATDTRPRRLRRLVRYGVMAAAVAGASFGVSRLGGGRFGGAAPPGVLPSIAVLPLDNYSPDAADAPLADAMTDELIDLFSRIGNLRVIGSASVFAFKGQPMDGRQIAESLHVSHILKGGFLKIGQHVRLQASVVDAASGRAGWSANLDGEFKDVFAMQDSIARGMIHHLGVRGAGARGYAIPPARRRTPRIDAYEWYLRGLRPTECARPSCPTARDSASRRRAIEYFNHAIALDSSFAAAYTELGRAYLGQVGDLPGKEQESLARGAAAALKAVALDDSLPKAHTELAWALMRVGSRPDRPGLRDFALVEAQFKRAISLNPRDLRALEGLGLVYLYTEEKEKNLEVSRATLEFDPFSYSAIRRLALALSVSNRCDDAIALLRPLQALHAPGEAAGIVTGQCYAARGQWPEAIAEFSWALKSGARIALSFVAYAQARGGQRQEALKILSDMKAGREYSFGSFGIGTVYAGLGDYEEAITWLERAADDGTMRPYIMGPMFDDLRRDPRFARVKARLGL